MTRLHRTGLLAIAAVLASSAGTMAADLYGGSLKDSGGPGATPSRPALFYARGDFSYGWNEFGVVNELPNYTDSNARMGSSRSFGGGFGIYFSPNVRGDLTLDRSNTASVHGTVLDGAATVQGERQFGVKHNVALANVYYDFNARSGITPYLGVGLGIARNTTTAGNIVITGCDAPGNGTTAGCAAAMGGATKTNAAAALMAGMSVKVGDRWTVDAGYRFLYTGDARTGDVQITRANNSPAYPQSTPGITVRDMYEHELRVGMRMDLR